MNSVKGTERQKSVYMSALTLDYDMYAYAFTETQMDQTVLDEMLFPESFSVYRCDSNLSNCDKQSGGGTLLAINRRLSSLEHSVAKITKITVAKITKLCVLK